MCHISFIETKLLEMQKGKGPESWKYVRKAFAGVLMRNENVF